MFIINEATPKKYSLPVNRYGNVPAEEVSNKWVTVDLRGDKGNVIKNNKKIYAYEVLDGFDDRGAVPKPITHYVIHQDQFPVLEREVEKFKKEKKAKKAQKSERQKAAEQKMKEQQKAKKAEQKAYFEALGIPYDRYAVILAEELIKYKEAAPEWLIDAHSALSYSIQNHGIMRGWKTSEEEFYFLLVKAIRAYRRHNYTSYDSINKRGMTDEQVAMLRQEANQGNL